MAAWADDPELVATFRAEVEERLASLSSGLLTLEEAPDTRPVVARLFRDAHTVKGSARMLGLQGVLEVAHRAEDLLAAVRDGRLRVDRPLVDALLAACDGIAAALPGGAETADPTALPEIAARLARVSQAPQPPRPPAPPDPVSRSTVVTVPVPPPPPPAPAPPPAPDDRSRRRAASVRVPAEKVHRLLDAAGEADLGARRISRAADAVLAALGGLPPEAAAASAPAQRALRSLLEGHRAHVAAVRDAAAGLAMVPVQSALTSLPRLVRDTAARAGVDVELVVSGSDVEVDKQVLDTVRAALEHLVVNAVDHGCEPAASRRAAGKPPRATVRVDASVAGSSVVLEVSDDGRGIDETAVRRAARACGLDADALSGSALLDLLFLPALSTAGAVSETSGRGVGLDVVRDTVEHLGGSVDLRSRTGRGTCFRLTLPVALGVLHCLLARVGDERYAVPLPAVSATVPVPDGPAPQVGGQPVLVHEGLPLPLVDLGAVLGSPAPTRSRTALVVGRPSGGSTLALAVDRLEGERELVVVGLGTFLGRVPGVAGAALDDDGAVVCVLDVRELADLVTSGAAPVTSPSRGPAPAAPEPPRVLVVEDSVGVRELERAVLERAGYRVDTAVDGLDGAARLRDVPADLVLSDVEMPGMDGLALTRRLRSTSGWEHVPVVIMTSRDADADRRAGLAAGANAYLVKQDFDPDQLVETVRRLVGR